MVCSLRGDLTDGKKIYTIQDKESTEGDNFEVPYIYNSGAKYINLYNRSPQQALMYLKSRKSKKGNLYGYINDKYEILIPPICEVATSFKNGYAKIKVKEEDNKFHINFMQTVD